MGKETLVPDEMPEKAHKSIHNVSFVFVALIVVVALFFISQAVFYVFVVDDEERAEMFSGGGSDSSVTLDKFLGHDYCGTFYVWLTVGNNYGTVENFEAAENVNRAVGGVVDNTIVTAAPILFSFVCLSLSAKPTKSAFSVRAAGSS